MKDLTTKNMEAKPAQDPLSEIAEEDKESNLSPEKQPAKTETADAGGDDNVIKEDPAEEDKDPDFE